MSKAIVSLMTVVISSAIQIWMMTSGWGLTAKSWPIILWAMVLQFVLLLLMNLANKDQS